MTGLVATLALTLTLAPGQADDGPLKWKLKDGDTFYVRTAVQSNRTLTISAQEQVQKTDHTRVEQFKVVKAAADGYTLEQTTLRSTTESSTVLDGVEDFDKTLLGGKLTFVLDKNFKVKQIDGAADRIKKLLEVNPAFTLLTETVVSEPAIKKRAEELFARGPTKAVKVGGEWKATEATSFGSNGDLTSRMVFTYARSKDNVEEVTFTGKAKLAPPKKAPEGALSKIAKSDVKSERHAGTLRFDSKTGRLKQCEEEIVLAGTLTLEYRRAEIEAEEKTTLTCKVDVFDQNPVKE